MFQFERRNNKQRKKMAFNSPRICKIDFTPSRNINSSWNYSNIFHLVGFNSLLAAEAVKMKYSNVRSSL